MSAHELAVTLEGDGEGLHPRVKWVCNATDDPDRSCAMPIVVDDCPDRDETRGNDCDGWEFADAHCHENPDPAGAECMYQTWFDEEAGELRGSHRIEVPIVATEWSKWEYPIAIIGVGG